MYPTRARKSNNLLLRHDNYEIHIKWYASMYAGIAFNFFVCILHTKQSTYYGNLLTADTAKFSVKHYTPNENE